MKRLFLLLIALCALAVPTAAFADGDPGSDVLYYQPLFSGAQDNLSVAQQADLGHLLTATIALKAQVRVAIIGQRQDLGFYTPLWGKPAVYADLLGRELALEYSGRLIVVMPQGVALYWFHHGVGTLKGIATGPRPAQLVSAATAAVTRVEAASGITAATLRRTARSRSLQALAVAAAHAAPNGAIATAAAPTAGTVSKANASATNVSPVIIVVGLVLVLGAVFWVPPVWRRRGVLRRGGIALPGLGIGILALGALVVLAVVVHSSGSTNGVEAAESTNPHLAGVTSLGDSRVAPAIALTDEIGHHVNLRQYRGKVVILSFTDDECQTICPLTTQAMVDARDSLGAAKRDVQLIGVNANRKSTSVDDVLSYTQLHGMLDQWHFLTGSDAQLEKIWSAYHVADDISTDSNLIDHTPGLYIIGPDGKERAYAQTYSSYASIPQFGQELAQEVARLLPSHPALSTHYRYSEIQGIPPTDTTTLQRFGGGTVTLGTAKHVYLFFATWDRQSTAIKAEMETMNGYVRQARRLGLPSLVAVDEGAVEPNPAALGTFLAGMHLDYPVAIDGTGQVADGYGVQGEPWFTLAVPKATNTAQDPTATTPWSQEVYTEGWPTVADMLRDIPASLTPPTAAQGARAVARQLSGSPPALAMLHQYASRLLPSGAAGLVRELKALRGHPVVVNVWASDCGPCQAEAGFFATESAKYGSKVAFLGVDYDDVDTTDAEGFLDRHHVYYPSFSISDGSVPSSLLPGGVEGTPTTIIFNAAGRRAYLQTESYSSQQQLDEQIQAYALGRSS